MIAITGVASFGTVAPKEINVAIYQNEPLVFFEEGTAQGFIVDLMDDMAKNENWSINYVSDSFGNGLESIENQNVDLMIGVAWSDQRAETYDYNKEALFVNWGQIYINPETEIESIQDLSGQKIGVMTNDIHYIGENGLKNTLDQFNINSNYYEFEDKLDIFKALEKGDLDAAIVNRTFGMQNAGDFEINKSSIQLNPVTLHVIAPNNTNEELLNIIDTQLSEWKSDDASFYHKRMMYWFDASATERIPSWIWMVLVGCIALLILSTVIIYVTQKLIQNQTSELRELNHTLEDKVEERTIDLDATNQQLKVSLITVEERTIDLDTTNQQLKVSLITLEEKQAELEEMNAILEEQVEMIERAQGHLIESEKMASLGRMVASLAHELNTPLGICVTLLTNMKVETKRQIKSLGSNALTKSCLTEYLDDMVSVSDMFHSNMDTVVDLVDRFKMLSSDRVHMNERKVNMYEYLHTQMDALSPELKQSSHAYKIDCPEDLEMVVDPSALSQVIRNLTMNSLIHGFEDINDGTIDIHVKKQNEKVFIEYTDDGKGIKSDIKSRMFEPFFTTKRNQGGTGLGLSIVHSAVTQTMSGEIRIDERQQNGLKYEIELPYRKKENTNFSDPNFSYMQKI